MAVTVTHLYTNQKQIFTCSPRDAVIAAYAQERKDFNTCDYEKRYGHLVEIGRFTYLCGYWSAFNEENRHMDPNHR